MTTSNHHDHLIASARSARGFMPDDEGYALFEAALAAGSAPAAQPAVLLEVGSWCGKSATYLGAAALETGATVISVDHHHGSEENQAGWDYFEADLVDPTDGRLNTLPHFQRHNYPSLQLNGLSHTRDMREPLVDRRKNRRICYRPRPFPQSFDSLLLH